MHDLNTVRGRSDFYQEIQDDVTHNVNYDFQERFVKGFQEQDPIAAWKAAYEAGLREAKLQIARKRFAAGAD